MVKISEKYICIDIGGTKVLGALFEGDKLLSKVKKKTKAYMGVDSIVEKIVLVVDEILETNNIKVENISAISAGFAGVVDEDNGIILQSPNLPMDNVNIKSIIEEKYKTDFYIANDVNMGALGEWKYGAGKGYSSLLGVFIGTGIGGGLVIDKKLYSGHSFGAGEIGHIIINSEGPLCGCGQRGCFEAFASKSAVLKIVESEIKRGRETILSDLLEGKFNVLKSKFLRKGMEENDELTIEVVNRMIHYTAVGVGSLINVLNPQVVIIGGGVVEALDKYIMPKLPNVLKSFTMPSILKNTRIKKASLGDDSILYGARALINMKK